MTLVHLEVMFLKELLKLKGTYQKRLANKKGLNKMTVSNIVAQIIAPKRSSSANIVKCIKIQILI